MSSRSNSMKRRSRHEDMEEEDRSWWDVLFKLGMPLLYILGLVGGIVGAICNGVITDYWSNLKPPTCFLYAKTPTAAVVYHFGTDVAACDWVTYGAVVSVIIATVTGFIYVLKVRGSKDLTYSSAISVTGIIIAFILMLAVTCTMAEGLRITFMSMGLNPANNKGESGYQKLDKRVLGVNLPVLTSTMVRAALISLISSTIIFFVICLFHLSDFYKRTLRHRYSSVEYGGSR